jgi:hypothetical protein
MPGADVRGGADAPAGGATCCGRDTCGAGALERSGARGTAIGTGMRRS